MIKSKWLLSTIILATALGMFFFSISCQYQKQDTEAEKAAITDLFDKYYTAISEKDVATLVSFLDEDGLFCGTDPSEFWNKQQITDAWTQMFAEADPEFNFISEREIKVAADGNSAIVVEQYLFPMFTPKIPWRNVYHLVKTNDNWMISFFSASFIPKNEDIPKFNAALE